MRLMNFTLILAFLAGGISCDGGAVQGVDESLRVEPPSLDFGKLPLGGTFSHSVILHNEGSARFEFEAEGLTEGVSLSHRGGTIGPGQQLRVEVRLSRVPRGAGEHVVRFLSTRSDARSRLDVSWEGVEQALDLPPVLDFEDVFLGKEKTAFLEVRSLVDVPLDVEIERSGDEAFSVEKDRLRLDPGTSAALDLTFEPMARGPASAFLLLRPCRGCREKRVTVQGRGLRYGLEATPNPLDFGRAAPGLSITRALEVRNTGDGPVSLSLPTWSPGGSSAFSVQEFEVDDPLEAGASGVVEVVFAPTALGSVESELRFSDREGTEVERVSLQGEGGGPLLGLSPPVLELGLQPIGRIVSKAVSLEGAGDPELVLISSVSVEGPDADLVTAVAPQLPFEAGIHPVEIEVSATFERLGDLRAQIVFGTNSESQPRVTLPLRASVTDPDPCSLVPSRSAVRFGNLDPSIQHSRTIHLMNEGGDDCFVWSVEVVGPHADAFPVEASSEPFFLSAGDSFPITIGFDRENAPERVELEADLVANFGPVGDPLVLPIIAMNTAIPYPMPEVVFEETPVGRVTVAAPKIRKPGAKYYEFTEDSSPAFRFPGGQPTTDVVCRGDGCPEETEVEIAFMPTKEGVHRGTLKRFSAGDAAFPPDYIEFEAVASPPCPACDWPEPHCDVELDPSPGEVVHLGDEPSFACNWRVESPASRTGFGFTAEWSTYASGYTLKVDSRKPCAGTFTPYLVGPYVLSNLRIREDGRAAYCEVQVDVSPPEGLWVEAFAEVDDELASLHLLLLDEDGGSPGERDSWFNESFVCRESRRSYHGSSCSWGSTGPEDDPYFPPTGFYSVGGGVEAPIAGKAYHIGLNTRPDGWGDEVPVDLRVYCNAQLVSEQTIPTIHDRLYVVGTVGRDAGGQCSYQPDGLTSFPHNTPP